MYIARVSLVHIPSINEAHQIGRTKTKVWLYINPKIKQMQDKIKNDLIKQQCADYFKSYKDPKYCFRVYLTFVLNKGFWTRDVSNLIKYVEDAIMAVSKIDDSQTISIDSNKLLNSKSEYEEIIVKIKPYLKNSISIEESENV